MIPGALETVAATRRRGMKIGSTTGYLREMMEINLRDARRQGYESDSTVCASDVPAARPYPYMCLQNVINLQVSPVSTCVKIDDTVPGDRGGAPERETRARLSHEPLATPTDSSH